MRAVLSDPRFVTSAASVPGGDVNSVRDNGCWSRSAYPASSSGYLTGSILDVDGADHMRLRKLVSRAFTVRRVGELRPRVEAITSALLDGFPTDGRPRGVLRLPARRSR